MIAPAPVLVTMDGDGLTQASTPDARQLAIACDTASAALLSSREMLLASLGSCLAASVEPLLKRHEVPATGLRIHLQYDSAHSAISVRITLPPLPETLLPRLQRAAANCPVRKALALPVAIEWSIAES